MVRSVAHDVKTPLNAIVGYVDVLESESRGPLNQQQRECTQMILAAATRAAHIMDTLVHIVGAGADTLPVEVEPTPVGTLVRLLVNEQQALFERAGLSVLLEVDDSIGTIPTDPELVQRVISNLLSNAVKYTPFEGQVAVCVEMRSGIASPLGTASVCIRVEDSGPGIPVAMREQVFDEFARLPGSAEQPGYGLGLAISRRLSRRLGGELTIDNAPAGGAAFLFWLPKPELIATAEPVLPI
jgi:signal transduction histidine kinase